LKNCPNLKMPFSFLSKREIDLFFLEVILLPAPGLTFRSIGGIFDLHFFLGPTPDEVVQQFTEVIGKPFLPPYWSLGYHQCRFGYKNLSRTEQVLEQTVKAKIPIDTQWNDLDYMSKRNDFTVDKTNFGGLKEFVEKLHQVTSDLGNDNRHQNSCCVRLGKVRLS
jgi:lysosomal alpha-glucosidase